MSPAVDKVPLCRICFEKDKKNFAQWVCDACREVDEPMLTECNKCASIVESPDSGTSLDFRLASVNERPAFMKCCSCKYLGRLNGGYLVHGNTTWCHQCIVAHKCNVCHRLVRAVDAVPLCSYCNDKGTKNFAQWTCNNCVKKDRASSLTACVDCYRFAGCGV